MTKILCLRNVLLLLFFSCSLAQEKLNRPMTEIDFQGHRGARGLYPENTLPAFKAAMDYGMSTIELDTVLTKDKQLIIHHDDNINPKLCIWTNGDKVESKPIKDFTVVELKKLDCGSLKNSKFPEQIQVPGTQLSTLKEFFQFVKEYEKANNSKKPYSFNIETKINADSYSREDVLEYADVMVKTIENAGVVNRATVQSFVIEVLPEVKKLNPDIKTSALFMPTKMGYILLISGINSQGKEIIIKAKENNADIISPYFEFVNPEFIRLSRENNLKVIPWTVNEEPLMRKLILFGVDGIISDYPDRLKNIKFEKVN